MAKIYRPNIGRSCVDALRFEGEAVSSEMLFEIVLQHVRSCCHEDDGLLIDGLIQACTDVLTHELQETLNPVVTDWDKHFIQGNEAWQLARDHYVSGLLSGYRNEDGTRIESMTEEDAQGVLEDFFWPECITWDQDRWYPKKLVKNIGFTIGHYDGVLKTQMRDFAKQQAAV